MSTVAVAQECCCGSIGADPKTVRFCDVEKHHRYWRGDKELISVSKILRATWPVRKNFEDAPAAVREHAKERGIRIDRHFSHYLRTGYLRVRAGDEWEEVRVGLLAVVDWWKAEKLEGRPQVILADDAIAGTADIVTERAVFDIKCVSALDPSYELQIGGYGSMRESIREGYLIHCKIDARNLKASVKVVPVAMDQAVYDWQQIRDVFLMAQRRISS